MKLSLKIPLFLFFMLILAFTFINPAYATIDIYGKFGYKWGSSVVSYSKHQYIVVEVNSYLIYLFIDSSSYLNICVIDKNTETVTRLTQITSVTFYSISATNFNSTHILIAGTIVSSSKTYGAFILYNPSNGAYSLYIPSTANGSTAQAMIISNIVKCPYDGYFYAVGTYISAQAYVELWKFTNSSATYVGYIISGPVGYRFIHIFTTSLNPQNIWIFLSSNAGENTASYIKIYKYNVVSGGLATYIADSPYPNDIIASQQVINLGERYYRDANGNVYMLWLYSFVDSTPKLYVKALWLNQTSGVSRVYTLFQTSVLNENYNPVVRCIGYDAHIINNSSDGVVTIYPLGANLKINRYVIEYNGFPYNDIMSQVLQVGYIPENMYLTTTPYLYIKYSDRYRIEISNDYKPYISTLGVYSGVRVYTLGMSYSPSESPLKVNNAYTYTVTALANNKAFNSIVQVYFNGTLLKTLDTKSGTASFTYTVSQSGFYNWTLKLYDNDVKAYVKTVSYQLQYVEVKPSESEVVQYQIVNLFDVIMGIIPIFFVVLLPAFLLALYFGIMGLFTGFTIGMIMGTMTGIVPLYGLYLYILILILSVIFMSRRGGGGGGEQ